MEWSEILWKRMADEKKIGPKAVEVRKLSYARENSNAFVRFLFVCARVGEGRSACSDETGAVCVHCACVDAMGAVTGDSSHL